MNIALEIIGIVISFIFVMFGLIYMNSRYGVKPVVDGKELPGGAIQIKDGYTSAFLLNAGGGKTILIDAGQDHDAKAIKAAMKVRGQQPENVVAILLTHGHNDHIGGFRHFPNAQIMCLAADKGLAEGSERSRSIIGKVLKTRPTGLKIDRVLMDNEALKICDLSVDVFRLPGHTSGSAAYLINDVLYLGDSAEANNDGTIRPSFWFFTDDTDLNIRSLKSLAARLEPEKVEYLTFSHSGVLEGFNALKDFARRH